LASAENFPFFDYEAPFRDILAEGVASTLEEAQDIAVKSLNALAYEGNIH